MTTSKRDIAGNWGEEAYELLSAITHTHSTKKKLTILALADAVYTGLSLNRVLKHNPDTASKTAHYKWLESDPAYKAAYDFLVGDVAPDAPAEFHGLARQRRDAEFDEDVIVAAAKVEAARVKLDMLSLKAVTAYEDALLADYTTVTGDGEVIERPDHRTRVTAANSIADRIPKLARNNQTDITSAGEKLNTAVTYVTENRPPASPSTDSETDDD